MSRFSLPEPTSNSDIDSIMSHSAQVNYERLLNEVGQPLSECVKRFEQGRTYHIWSHGRWSSHHILEQVVKQHGPADVWFTSWVISAPAVQKLIQLREKGHLHAIHALLDLRVKTHSPEASQLVEKTTAKLRLTKIHAKTMVIIGGGYACSIVTSANLTTNRRVERFVVTFDTTIAHFDQKVIQTMMEDGVQF